MRRRPLPNLHSSPPALCETDVIPDQPARLAHVRLAVPRRAFPVEPPQVTVLAAGARRDHELLLWHQVLSARLEPYASRRPRTASTVTVAGASNPCAVDPPPAAAVGSRVAARHVNRQTQRREHRVVCGRGRNPTLKFKHVLRRRRGRCTPVQTGEDLLALLAQLVTGLRSETRHEHLADLRRLYGSDPSRAVRRVSRRPAPRRSAATGSAKKRNGSAVEREPSPRRLPPSRPRGELARLGSLLNQTVRLAHQGKAPSGAGRSCLAACCATSCSRFALRSNLQLARLVLERRARLIVDLRVAVRLVVAQPSRTRCAGSRGEDAEDEAAGRGGVDLCALAGEHPQADAAGRQVLHGVDQVGEVAAEQLLWWQAALDSRFWITALMKKPSSPLVTMDLGAWFTTCSKGPALPFLSTMAVVDHHSLEKHRCISDGLDILTGSLVA